MTSNKTIVEKGRVPAEGEELFLEIRLTSAFGFAQFLGAGINLMVEAI